MEYLRAERTQPPPYPTRGRGGGGGRGYFDLGMLPQKNLKTRGSNTLFPALYCKVSSQYAWTFSPSTYFKSRMILTVVAGE